jgi:hypothetical protein
MNATGTEHQRAVIAAFKVRPEALRREIADAAGVTVAYVDIVLKDYLESKAHEPACQVAVRASPKPADVATFALDRRFGGNSGPEACTVKQQACRNALAEHPPESGETKMHYCRRLAAIAGVSAGYVQNMTLIIEAEQIGAYARAKEEARSKTEIAPLSLNARAIRPMPEFKGWADVFSRFKLLAEAYVKVARSRGDAFAESFLKDMCDHAERAETRSWEDRSVA